MQLWVADIRCFHQTWFLRMVGTTPEPAVRIPYVHTLSPGMYTYRTSMHMYGIQYDTVLRYETLCRCCWHHLVPCSWHHRVPRCRHGHTNCNHHKDHTGTTYTGMGRGRTLENLCPRLHTTVLPVLYILPHSSYGKRNMSILPSHTRRRQCILIA
jgi:hypothetical protein